MYFACYFSRFLCLELILLISDFFIPFINHFFLCMNFLANPITHCRLSGIHKPLLTLVQYVEQFSEGWNYQNCRKCNWFYNSAFKHCGKIKPCSCSSSKFGNSCSLHSENAVELHRRFPTSCLTTTQVADCVKRCNCYWIWAWQSSF